MSKREKPPVPGLTRVNTGVIHDVYSTATSTWYVTFAEQKRIAKRAKQTDDQPASDGAVAAVKAARSRGWNTGKRKDAAA